MGASGARKLGLFACAPEFESEVLERSQEAIDWVGSRKDVGPVARAPDDPVVGMHLGQMWDVVDFMVAEAVGCGRGDTGLGWPAGYDPQTRSLVPISDVQQRVALAGVGLLQREDPVDVCEFLWDLDDFLDVPSDDGALSRLLSDLRGFLEDTRARGLQLFVALGT